MWIIKIQIMGKYKGRGSEYELKLPSRNRQSWIKRSMVLKPDLAEVSKRKKRRENETIKKGKELYMWDEGWKGEINWGIRVESWWEWKIGEKWELGLGLVGLRWSLTARNEWVAVRRRCPLGTGSQIFVCILILFCKKGVTNPFFICTINKLF